MSLLDNVSIVVTPNGYKAGELYAVIPVPSEGAELITNGNFASDLTGWTGYGTTSATGGVATIGASANSGILQSILTEGVRYNVTVNVTSYDGVGTAQFVNNNGNNLYTITSTGIQTFTFISTIASSNLIIRGTSNALFSVSSVSVKEYTAADIDVTRATAATRVDEAGLIKDVLSNVPRIDYTGGGCPYILAEPQRTNLVDFSESYGTGTYFSITSGSTIDNTTSTSPSGDNNATQLTSTGAGKLQTAGKSLTQNTDYVLSFYAKNVDATEVQSRVLGVGGSGGSNLIAVSYFSQISTTEWNRITHSFNTGTNTSIFLYLSNSLNSGGTIQLWGAQLEEASYATSYIPTSGSTVTRNQDQFSRDGVGSLINSTEGVLFVEMAVLAADTINRYISLSNGTDDNSISFHFRNNTNNQVRVILKSGNVNQFDSTYNPSGSTAFAKVAFKYKVNDFALWVNGTEIATDTSGITFSADTLNRLAFDDGQGGGKLFGKVKQLQVYKTALTDAQLTSLTS